MERYQICYIKSHEPLTTWMSDKTQAVIEANRLREAGYTVQIWAHTKEGAHKLDL